jgi:GNAT superfamily N-acetyltransferase
LIRKATLKDSLRLQDLCLQLNPDDPLIDESVFKEKLSSILINKNLEIFVNQVDNQIISSCYLNITPNLTRNGKPYAVIENVVTDKKYRKQGYGKETLLYAIDYAWQKDCYKIMLMTSSKEDSVLNFYRSCGFDDKIKTAFLIKP